jgi:ADP-dependent NAD(P)H-hydrate dehydratase / NAD(P)H-hydrate epimerase
MKILSAENTRKADAYTIAHEPVRSIDLMERAANAFVSIFIKYISPDHHVNIFCGTGNNGGDGLAVARMLFEKGYEVQVFLINPRGDKGSPDFEFNLERLGTLISPVILREISAFPDLPRSAVLIDAIFGSGLTRPVEGLYAALLEKLNRQEGIKISIDIASGLFADRPAEGGVIFEPDLTITFQAPKLAFMIPENGPYVGKFEVADIGLNKDFINTLECDNHFIEAGVIADKLVRRQKFSHKGMFGSAAIISGSLGKMGAAVLAGRACLRSGVGLLTMHVPRCGYEIIQTSVPEAMTTVDTFKDLISEIPDLGKIDVVGVGPGIGTDPKTKNMLSNLLDQSRAPVVMDADAINLLAKYRDLLDKVPQGSILTPHIKEFERIAGDCPNHFERLALQKKFSIDHKVIIILKGAYSAISFPNGQTYFNSTGNPGMATGGSGDVLTGITTGFLAKKYSSEDAALLSTYLHGLAGDLASAVKGLEGLVAGDIIDLIPEAIKISAKTSFF